MDKKHSQTETLLFGEVPIITDLNSDTNISDNKKDIIVKIAENSVNSQDPVISEKFEEIIESEKNGLNGHQNGFKTDKSHTVIDINGGECFSYKYIYISNNTSHNVHFNKISFNLFRTFQISFIIFTYI